ncbi:putative transketolase, partial [human gut metagenome]
KIPVVSCAGSFLSARATEQVKIDAGYSHRHMLLCAQSPGLAYGALGSTHHRAEYLHFDDLNAMNNQVVMLNKSLLNIKHHI